MTHRAGSSNAERGSVNLVRIALWILAGLLFTLSPRPALAADWENRDLSQILRAKGAIASIAVKGTNGYRITIDALRREAMLQAEGRSGLAIYQVPAVVEGDRINARFGRRGRVAIRFVIRRVRRVEPPSRCAGGPRVFVHGTFLGRIKFVGEQRFTQVDRARAPGEVSIYRRWKCPNRDRGELFGQAGREKFSGPQDEVQLNAVARQGTLRFVASSYPPFEGRALPPSFNAFLSERLGAMEVVRLVTSFGSPATFLFTDAFTQANIRPPKPFSGRGFFEQQPDGSRSWSGSLRVSLPGARNVRLTGRDFSARLYDPSARLPWPGFAIPSRLLGSE